LNLTKNLVFRKVKLKLVFKKSYTSSSETKLSLFSHVLSLADSNVCMPIIFLSLLAEIAEIESLEVL